MSTGILGRMLVIGVLVIATLLHGILLLNPFWFRERALQAFGRHHFLKLFSAFSIWFNV